MGRDREPLVGHAAEALKLALSGLALLVFSLHVAACSRSDAPAPIEHSKATASATAATNAGGPLVIARGIRLAHAAAGPDAAKVVRDAQAQAKLDGRDLVVYVGASWCEPCQRFHAAAARGDLDADFPALTLLEFDADNDQERLKNAGYVTQYIPLFVMPDSNGRATNRRFSGSVKGDGAVANIAPRLRNLLGH